MTDEEMARLKLEGDECRKELERRIAPMKQGPFTPPDYVLRLQAEVERLKGIGQQCERDSRKFFDQSCLNLQRAEKAEAEVERLNGQAQHYANVGQRLCRERDEARAEVERLHAQSAGLGIQRLRARQERDEARAQAAAMRVALLKYQEVDRLDATADERQKARQMRCDALAPDAGRGYLSPDDAKRLAARAVLEERAELRRSLELTHEEEKRALVDHVVEACADAADDADWQWNDDSDFIREQTTKAIRALDRSKLLGGK